MIKFNLIFSCISMLVFNFFMFSGYFYLNRKYKEAQPSLLKDLKKAIKTLLIIDLFLIMILVYLFSII